MSSNEALPLFTKKLQCFSEILASPKLLSSGTDSFISSQTFLFVCNTGFLKVSDIHNIYFEEVGNPQGKPVVFIHGGPGGGITPDYRRFFNPSKWRVILFDQRGCGKSEPFAELKENTTWDLVADIEKIRTHLDIKSWSVFGGSWGSTLALAYGQKHPSSVDSFFLRGIFMLRPKELRWFYQEGASYIFPDEWEKYEQVIPQEERSDFISAYYKRLTSEKKEEIDRE